MGLDQYLYRETHVNHSEKYAEALSGFHKLGMNPEYVKEEVAYWRKANHIHNWFVKNVQNGVDDCSTYYVYLEQLEELLALCKTVLQMRDDEFSKENLPTTSGFFFGSTEYDDGYYGDVEDTIEMLGKLIEKYKDDFGGDFYYRSSW